MQRRTFWLLVFMVAGIGLAIWAGWLGFSGSQDKSSIDINTQEIKDDTRKAIDAGKDLFEKAKDEAKEIKQESTETKPELRTDESRPVPAPLPAPNRPIPR